MEYMVSYRGNYNSPSLSCDTNIYSKRHRTKKTVQFNTNSNPTVNTSNPCHNTNIATPTTNIHVINNLTNPKTEAHKTNTSCSSISNLNLDNMSRPDKFTVDQEIRPWLKQMELYLELINQSKCTNIVLSFLSKEVLLEIGELEQYREQDGNKKLINNLLDSYCWSGSSDTDEKITLEEWMAKKQKWQTISDYGEQLIQTAKSVFKDVTVEQLDDILQQRFIDGLENKRLKEECTFQKIDQKEIKNNKFNINDLIKFAIAKEASLKKIK